MRRNLRGKTTPAIVEAARRQRRAMTPAEKKLWEALRGRRLADLKFRHLHPFGPFVLDAFCVQYQLEVEVDGAIHSDPAVAAHDAARTEYLQQRGIRVFRFSNEDIELRLDDVLKTVVEACR